MVFILGNHRSLMEIIMIIEKTRMSAHLKAMSRKLWRVVNDGYVILDTKNLTPPPR